MATKTHTVDEVLDRGREVIEAEAGALNQLACHLDGSFSEACAAISRVRRQLVVTGMGKSGHIARKGMVCVNSTSATLALEVGTPVAVLGDAIYDIPGITQRGHLDNFWSRPVAPDAELYAAFKRVLHAKCLVRGGLASASATAILVRNSVARLLADDLVLARQTDPPRIYQAVG